MMTLAPAVLQIQTIQTLTMMSSLTLVKVLIEEILPGVPVVALVMSVASRRLEMVEQVIVIVQLIIRPLIRDTTARDTQHHLNLLRQAF
jgi:hypothetical protein